MSNKQLTALLISNPTNIRYKTGFVGVSETEREAYVLVVHEQKILFTNALYRETARQLENIEVVEISRDEPLSKKLKVVLKKLNVKTLEYEDTNLTVAELNKLSSVLSGITLSGIRDRIEIERMIKRDDEIEQIKKAAAVTDQCFAHIKKRIKPGITEARIAWEIEGFLRNRAGGMAFDPIVAFNEHSSMPHYLSRGNLPLRKNSLILLDFGAKVNGYCADMTRVVFLGKPKPEWVLAYEIVMKAQQTALRHLSSRYHVPVHDTARRKISAVEISGAETDKAARNVIEKAGLPVYPHSLGHAVGLDIHEAPRLTVKKPEMLFPGMVVTIEPGTYLPGQFGIRIEDLVQIRPNSINVLSKSKKDITIL